MVTPEKETYQGTMNQYLLDQGIEPESIELWANWVRRIIRVSHTMGVNEFIHRSEDSIRGIGLTYGEPLEGGTVDPLLRHHIIAFDPSANTITYFNGVDKDPIEMSHVEDFYPVEGRLKVLYKEDKYPRNITEATIGRNGIDRVIISEQLYQRTEPVFVLHFDHRNQRAQYVDMRREGGAIELASFGDITTYNGMWTIEGQREGMRQILQVTPNGISGFTQELLQAPFQK